MPGRWQNENQTEAQISFEKSYDSSSGSTTSEYKTPFMDYVEGEGIFVNLRSILTRVEMAEIGWPKLRFETKS